MVRRWLFTMLVVLQALQLAGFVSASPCLKPCPDNGAEEACPPICSLCRTCAQTQQAIVQATTAAVCLPATLDDRAPGSVGVSSVFAVEIFHVPLLG